MGLNAHAVPNVLGGVRCGVSIGANRFVPINHLHGGRVTIYSLMLRRRVIVSTFTGRGALKRLVLVSHVSGVASTYNIIRGPALSRAGSLGYTFTRKGLGTGKSVFRRCCCSLRTVGIFGMRPSSGACAVNSIVPIGNRACRCPSDFSIIILHRRMTMSVHSRGIATVVPLTSFTCGSIPIVGNHKFTIRMADTTSISTFGGRLSTRNDRVSRGFFGG